MDATYDDSILRSLRRITRAIDVYSRKLAATYKITAPQLVCLRYLDRNGPHTPSELAREASLSQATVTGIIDRLEARGLAERRRDNKDRRRVSIHLTEEGKRLSQVAPTPLQELFAARLAELPHEEQAGIDKILHQVAEMMGADKWKENSLPEIDGGPEAAGNDKI
jgi:DNA-binding MarR family transcriptional regulator